MHRKHQGQSVVELALISLILVLFLAVTIDVSRAFSAYIAIGNMARAGAQAGSVNAVLGAESKSDAKALIEDVAFDEQGMIFGGSPTVESRLCEDSAGYELVQVRVRYDFQPLLAIGPASGPFPLERQVELRAQLADMRADFNDNCY